MPLPRQRNPVAESDFLAEAALLRVLAHPLRLKLVHFLMVKPANVKLLWTSLKLPQSVVSQQLAILKARGILKGVRRGNTVTYSVADGLAEKLVRLLAS